MSVRPSQGSLPARWHGLTLVELLLALTIGSFLMIGTFTIYLHSRATYRINESIARLQENARYGLEAIEPDIRMAGFWGLSSYPATITGSAGADDPVAPLAPAGDCGPNWSLDLQVPIAGTNNRYGLACTAYGTAMAGADTLVVRRAAVDVAAPPAAGTLYVKSRPGSEGSALIAGGTPAEPLPDTPTEMRALIVNGYYVSRNSTLDTPGNRVPSLRRKLLRGGASGATIADEEVLPGVEDLQIQLGIDTDLDSAVDRYVNADDALLDPTAAAHAPDARILSVRVWLRLRSERREPGIPADTGYAYADRVVPALNDGYRRLVISKTLQVRNAWPSS